MRILLPPHRRTRRSSSFLGRAEAWQLQPPFQSIFRFLIDGIVCFGVFSCKCLGKRNRWSGTGGNSWNPQIRSSLFFFCSNEFRRNGTRCDGTQCLSRCVNRGLFYFRKFVFRQLPFRFELLKICQKNVRALDFLVSQPPKPLDHVVRDRNEYQEHRYRDDPFLGTTELIPIGVEAILKIEDEVKEETQNTAPTNGSDITTPQSQVRFVLIGPFIISPIRLIG